MKKIFSFLVLFIVVSTAYSQHTIYIGAQGGICIPNLSAGNIDPLSTGFESALGADFGALAEFSINKWFSIQPEIDYSQEGGKRDGLQPFINQFQNIAPQPYLYADYNAGIQLNYLLIPVMAKFKFAIAHKLEFYINAGGYIGLLLKAKTKTSGNSLIYYDAAGQNAQQVYPGIYNFDQQVNITDSLKTFNAGVITSIGFSYDIGRGKIFIEGGGNYGFVTVQKSAANGANNALAATMHLGYAYSLRKRKKIQ